MHKDVLVTVKICFILWLYLQYCTKVIEYIADNLIWQVMLIRQEDSKCKVIADNNGFDPLSHELSTILYIYPSRRNRAPEVKYSSKSMCAIFRRCLLCRWDWEIGLHLYRRTCCSCFGPRPPPILLGTVASNVVSSGPTFPRTVSRYSFSKPHNEKWTL